MRSETIRHFKSPHNFPHLPHHPIRQHQHVPIRQKVDPHPLIELPSQIRGRKHPPVSFDLCHNCKYLVFLHRFLNHTLCISHNIILIPLHLIDPVHDVLSVTSLIKYNITSPQVTLRSLEVNGIPLMLKEREHTHTGNVETHTVAVLYELAQYGQIGLRVNCTDGGFWRFFVFHDSSFAK